MLAFLAQFLYVECLHDTEIHLEQFGTQKDIQRNNNRTGYGGDKEHQAQVDGTAGDFLPGISQTQHPTLEWNHSTAHHQGQQNAAEAIVTECAVLAVTAGISNVGPDSIQQQPHGDLADYDGGPHEDEHEAPGVE